MQGLSRPPVLALQDQQDGKQTAVPKLMGTSPSFIHAQSKRKWKLTQENIGTFLCQQNIPARQPCSNFPNYSDQPTPFSCFYHLFLAPPSCLQLNSPFLLSFLPRKLLQAFNTTWLNCKFKKILHIALVFVNKARAQQDQEMNCLQAQLHQSPLATLLPAQRGSSLYKPNQ